MRQSNSHNFFFKKNQLFSVPACTAAMYESGSCSPLGLAARAGKVAELLLLTHDAFAAATGCKRTCEKR